MPNISTNRIEIFGINLNRMSSVMIHLGYTASLTLLSLSATPLPILIHLTMHAYSSLHITRTIATYQPLLIPVLYP